MDELVANKNTAKKFVTGLLQWNQALNEREMPWKGEKDPYKIWLSEIILQQTRVEQGLQYYNRFIEAFPVIEDLANAPEQQVLKLWEGLGYYSRCRNLITTAKLVTKENKGVFPNDYQSILNLKGIGPYTAAAIASFAYNLPHAVLDGNVFRVLSRIFAIEIPVDSSQGKKIFTSLAQDLLPKDKPAAYNQAIMDFGATICKPLPECAQCFFQEYCSAFLKGKQQLLPVKEKKVSVRNRWLNYVVLKQGDRFAIRQRTEKDIWQNLYEFLLIETEKKASPKQVLLQFQKSYGVSAEDLKLVRDSHTIQQRLSHQLIYFQFIKAELLSPALPAGDYLWVTEAEIKLYPFPKTLQEYIHSRI
jgi:A/G-specific adenine glycosylase